MTVVCRTVLDLRSPLDKYIVQTMLLAASWHRFGRDCSALEIKTVGGGNGLLSRFFAELGIHHEDIAPGRNDDFSKTANKIEAAHADRAGRRVLLLDNDVCFLGSVADLDQLPANAIAASEPGTLRVSDAQWSLIDQDLQLPTLRRRFTPVNDQWKPPDELPEHYLYLNSGVVLFPAGHDHREIWASHQRLVFDFFKAHLLRTAAVTSSDQAGFATSVAAHGDFAWLPLRFNYRRGSFHAGTESLDRIAIVHLTGDVSGDRELNVSDRLLAYWEKFVFPGMQRAFPVCDFEKRRRHEIAVAVRDTLLSVAGQYNLEGWLLALRKSRR